MSHQPTLHKANKPCSAYQHCLLPPQPPPYDPPAGQARFTWLSMAAEIRNMSRKPRV